VYSYPTGDLDKPTRVRALLGSFWAATYDGRDQLLTYADGMGRAASNILTAIREASACLGVKTVPVFHREDWSAAPVLASTLAPGQALPAFGQGAAFGPGSTYGVTTPASTTRVPLGKLAEAPLVLDGVDANKLLLCEGLDYTFEAGTASFIVDPAADKRWPRNPVFDARGRVIDAELTPWVYRPGIDERYIADHYGYILGVERSSSERYKALVNALWDALAVGPSLAVLEGLLAAACGAPVATHDDEVVEVIQRDGRGLFVATDKAVYRFANGATPVVSVGTILKAGDPLSDATRVINLNRGTTCLPPGLLPALAMPPGVLAPGFLSDIVAEDRDVPLIVGTDRHGRTTVRFELSGFPADVDAFWAAVHEAGTREGATSLARLLDVRGPNAATEPTAASLPTTINPLRFLLDNVFRGATVLICVNAGSLPSDTAGLADLALLR
jgi:hypothetical protein